MAETARDEYGRTARFYDRLLEPVNAPLRSIGIRLIALEPSMTVLDVGCGTGGFLEACAEAGATCHGLDASAAMIAEAEKRLGSAADLTFGDATDLPYAAESYDRVVASLFLHQLTPDDRLQALSELERVLRPDGRILIVDFHAGDLTVKGRLIRGVSSVVERIAGREHYRGFRTYLRTGGLVGTLAGTGLTVAREKVVSGGNMGFWLLTKT